MTAFQKVAMGVVAVAMVTTLVYPSHKTADVVNAVGTASKGTLQTVIEG